MKFFNFDCHISVILDLKYIFEKLGHTVHSKSISGHNWVLNREPDSMDIVNQHNWHNLDEEMCNNFYERYKDELSEYDGFICTYPLSFSLLYEKFDKPILLHIPIRYEVPFQNKKQKWELFNDFLRRNIDTKKIIPVANSLYDKKYFEFFVNRDCDYIPSLCEYTNTKWSPENENFLLYSPVNINLGIDNVTTKQSLGRYKWSDLTKFKGIIMFPYNCSLMSIFEYYSSNIPLFCPSKNLMLQLYRHDKNSFLSQLTWNQVFNLESGSIISCDKNRDPNDFKNIEIMREWIGYSDFFNEEWMPHITYFDSIEDLQTKLNTVNLLEISNKMSIFNKIRNKRIITMWDKKIKSIQ